MKRLACSFSCYLAFACSCIAQESIPRIDSLKEVVVTASRFAENLLVAPVTISKLTSREARNSPQPSLFDAVGSLKGVHMITPSLGFKILDTRGFSNTTNVRFVQLIDNIDNQSPHIGAPIATALCPGDLDITNVEIIQGVASALYGLNATNGLANIITKNPFEFPGLSVQQQLAVNHLNDHNNVTAKLFAETAVRWAHILSQHWAVKINAGFVTANDWVANNLDDLNPNANKSTGLVGLDNPGYDAVNSYGNESSNRRTISLGGKNYVVARSGYAERDVADYNLKNYKGNLSLYYRPGSKSTYTYNYRVAQINNIYQRSNRFRLQNYLLQQHSFQFNSPKFQARTYLTSENTGDSYNLRSMAENLDYTYKNTNQWYSDYSNAFNDAFGGGASAAVAHREARTAADLGRPQPGTSTFNEKMNVLQQVNNWDAGAALKVRAHLLHAEASVNMAEVFHTPFNWFAGADYRNYIIIPDGNYFINPSDSNSNLQYRSYGLFMHGTKDFLKQKLQVGLAVRTTKYDYFNLKWNPRVTVVYNHKKNEVFRFSYQKGYRFASIFEGFSNINSGGVKRVGGLKVMSNGIFENSWTKISIDAFVAAVNNDVNTAGLTQSEAIENNSDKLQRNTYSYLRPEQMHSLEVGYRHLWFGRLILDGDFYYNFYRNSLPR
jgi:outer membrane receptor protein involved in Fe transport